MATPGWGAGVVDVREPMEEDDVITRLRSVRFSVGRVFLCGGVLAMAVAAATATAAAGAAHRTSQSANPVTITRDRAGIPHIVARNFTSLGYGEAYAFAQDNLCTLANDMVTVEGQRSKYFGPKALAVNYSAGTYTTNLQSDLYWRYIRRSGLVQRELKASPPNGLLPQVRDVYIGFAEGYNHYLRSGKLNDPTCKGKPWVKPITVTDMILRGQQVVTEGSAQQFISGIVQATPPTAGAKDAHAKRVTRGFADLRRQFGPAAQPAGSNGIGLGSKDTRSGQGMVLANPHFPWRGTERFWMAQLDVPGSYDVEGGTLMGFPLIGIGFNRHIAWTHTVSTSRRFVLYQLKLVPGHPTSYYLNGKAVKMGHRTITLHYRGKTVHHTFYTTHWGVVLDVPSVPGNLYSWGTSNAYALYDAVAGVGPRAANQYFEMGRATSVKDLYNVEAKWLAIPTFNTIAADDHGNAYYGDVGATPAVTQSKLNACLPPGVPTLIYDEARVITLDGSQRSCAPANFPGTPQNGIFTASHLPHLFRRDYVENSNDSYWLANPSHPLTGYSPIIGLTGTEQDLRTRIGNHMIAARVAGTDGLGPAKFTIPTLQRMWEGDRSELAALVLRPLAADCRAHPEQIASNGHVVNLTPACHALAHYNGTGRLGAKGGWLFEVWADLDGDSHFYATPFNAADPLTTPSGLNTSPSATPLRWLADAVLSLRGHHIPLDASFGQVQHAPQSKNLFVPGCEGDSSNANEGVGCFNAIYANDGTPMSTGPLVGYPYGTVYDGSSLVMTTQLNPGGPVAEGILTYSQATNRRSPWYSNMTKLYSERRWVKLAYSARALANEHPEAPLTLRVP
jgi:acyl-homoserine-lactone acylase